MSRVITRIIVSNRHELPYVLMNLSELRDISDIFLLTEANKTIAGEPRDFEFLEVFEKNIASLYGDKVKYIAMDMSEKMKYWNDNEEILHSNEQLLRNNFVNYYQIENNDIVISMDGDEVLYGSTKLKFLVIFLKMWKLSSLSFTLGLNQFIYFVNLYWTDCNFYGPIVAHAKFFQSQSNPQWRYGGKRIKKNLGCHFSWCLPEQEMLKKIMSYAHRKENEKFANIELLKRARNEYRYIFEPERPFNVEEIKSCRNRIYPKSFATALKFINNEIVLDKESFVHD